MKVKLFSLAGATIVCALLGYLGFPSARRASADTIVASDNRGDSAYASGWNSGTNGGTGFEPWSFQGSGQFVGISPIGKAWGFETTSLSSAGRSFSGGALTVGETFSVEMDAGPLRPVAASLRLTLPTPQTASRFLASDISKARVLIITSPTAPVPGETPALATRAQG